ncbi:MAG: ABC transporter substrate-binding protein [Azonexus sp.]|jgi:ABC-type branched-subunit amino acid transport system substrate-binding protein|nr:ABC transporter substrate-binding protein [Azonexus sp.]
MRILKRLAAASALALAAWHGSAEPGVTDNSVTIGMSVPLTGPSAVYGLDMQKTITAYFEQINKAGGINGRKLELAVVDDGYETERMVANTRKLIDENKAFALLAYYGSSPTTEAMNKVFGPAKVPLVGSISGAPSLRESIGKNPNSRYMFNVRASYAEETEIIVKQLVSLGLTKIAVFYQNDGYGQSGLDGVSDALKKHDLRPVAAGAIERNSLDVGKAVDAIARTKPQAVVTVSLYKQTAAFIRAMKKTGQNPMFMSLSSIDAERLVEELGKDARGVGISQVAPYPWNDTVPVVREYQSLVAKPDVYTYYGMEAYLMARTLVEGLRRAGRDLSRERLVSALESMNPADLGGYQINYSPFSRQGSRFVELTVIGSGGRVLR